MQHAAAIVGAAVTEVGKVYGRSGRSFAAEAVRLAVADAGLTLADVDGLLINTGKAGGVDLTLARRLGLRDLRVLSEVNAFGASAGIMVAQAAAAVLSGTAEVVVCVFADAPRQPGDSSGAAYRASSLQATGFRSAETAAGFTSVNHRYALAASRYLNHYRIPQDHLGAVAVSQRAWAVDNPMAQMRTPLTLDDYHRSRWIVEPLHLLDCCLVSNGGAAVVVTTPERAADLAQPPVRVLGWGQSHPGYILERGSDFGLVTGAASAGPAALKMAGLTPADIDLRQIYDCYTYTVLVTLEDYGFCGKGEAGELAASGALAPGGTLPTNTGGGQLSAFYLWGMTPLIEAVTQIRGHAGVRQVPRHETAIVSGNGGILDHHATLVLGGV
ncbi:sterol carrier protein (plasmid) [Rhodococcus oxybenzonivorans]|uniref:Sterol carrier protein n=1 Tax=Rhodococcus oxybenzonivorans TaxID=1990687 RepID=A0A2S2C652_9NOCA|nr:thiolase family protein [Rhodococcus oxybenzonivorans]AWK76293.1 sterol carrier protein [Rhodococcus oxybenzonivorans]